MKQLNQYIDKAKTSTLWLWVLNNMLWWAIPFNKPHKLKIISISNENVVINMPYIRKNLNHIKGLHACGLATLCEYACGMQLINLVGAAKYRIIMSRLEMDYYYQAKTAVNVDFQLSKAWVDSEIIAVLEKEESVVKTFEVLVNDTAGNKICRATIHWQIKPWDKVRTKI